MKVIVSIIILYVFHHLVLTHEISSETLDELEDLIKTYKKSISEKDEATTVAINKPSVDKSLEVKATQHHGFTIADKHSADRCARTARFNNQECNTFSKTEKYQRSCARVFVGAYQKCYFGDTLYVGSKKLNVCEGSCLWNFDQCLMTSSKIEMFICISGREMCRKNCPWTSRGKTKKSTQKCHNHCEGTFDQCLQIVKYVHERFVCILARSTCRNDEC